MSTFRNNQTDRSPLVCMVSANVHNKLAFRHSQSADDCTADESLNPTYNYEYQGSDPNELPVAPLYDAGPQPNNQVYASNQEQCPIYSEAHDVAWIVEVV